MTDIEHAKKYAEESISLATSMYNPRAEKIAELACLYGLTYKNKQLTKAKEIIKKLKALYFSPVVTNDDVKRQDKILSEVEQFLCEVEK